MKQLKRAAAAAAVMLGLLGFAPSDATAGAAGALRTTQVQDTSVVEQVYYGRRYHSHNYNYNYRRHYRPYVHFYTAPRYYYHRPHYSYSYSHKPYRHYRW